MVQLLVVVHFVTIHISVVQLVVVVYFVSIHISCYLECFPPSSTVQNQKQANSTKQAANGDCKQHACNDRNRVRLIRLWGWAVGVRSYGWSCSFMSRECRSEIEGGRRGTWDWIRSYKVCCMRIGNRKAGWSALVIIQLLHFKE